MKQETISIYKFSELSPEVQAKLVTNRAEANHSWLAASEIESYMRDNITQPDFEGPDNPIILHSDLFEVDKINFSLGNSQGDGVAISGSFDTKRLIDMYRTGRIMSEEDDTILWLLRDEIGINIKQSSYSNYSHKYTLDYDCDSLTFNEEYFVNSYLRHIGTDPEEFDEIDGGGERGRLSRRSDELAEEVAKFGLELVRDACDRAEKLGYEMIDDASSEERAREELIEDEEEIYTEGGRVF